MSNPFERDWTRPVASELPDPVKTPNAYADVTVILDRSASMQAMVEGVVTGFNNFVKSVRARPGDTRWSMVAFDDHDSARGAGEPFPQVLYENRSEREVPFLRASSAVLSSGPNLCQVSEMNDKGVVYQPRGSTALVDAVCMTIERTKLRTSGQEDRTQVVIMIITDGEENRSREYSSTRMRELVAETQKKGWAYQFLAANMDAFREADKYGLNQSMDWLQKTAGGGLIAPNAQNSFGFVPTTAGVQQAIASGMIATFHLASGAIVSGQIVARPDVVV